jgi:hypothetical protein
MPSRAPARRLVVGGFVALAAIIGAAAWPLSADPDIPNPAEQAEHDKAQELLSWRDDALRRHGPSDKELGNLRGKLEKKIKVDFTDVSTLEVMSKLMRDTGIPFVIDNLTLLEGDGKVTMVAPAISIRDALSQACDSFTHERGDWCVVNGAIVISSARQVAVRTTTTRHYDIRHLLVQVPNFTSPPSLDLDQSLSNTSSGGSTGGPHAATTLFAAEGFEGEGLTTREEMVEQVITMIQDTVGVQAEWQAYGGELSSIREINGKLTVRTSARCHEEIEALLAGLSQSQNEMIHLEARCMVVKTSVLDQLKSDNDGELIFDAAATNALLKKLGEDKSVRRVAMGRYMMRNGQRAHVAATLDKSFLSDVEPVAGTGGADPTISVARNGMVIDVEASASPEGDVNMTLRAQVATGGATGSSKIPIGPGYPSPEHEKKKEENPSDPVPDFSKAPDCGEEPTAPPATPKANPPRAAARPAVKRASVADSATISTPSQDTFRVNTSLCIPSNGAAIFSGSSKEQTSIGEDLELVVIIRAKAAGDSAKKNRSAGKK